MPAPTSQWEPEQKVIDQLNGGFIFAKPGSKLQDNEFTSVQNVQYFRGILRADTGYLAFGNAVQGSPQATFQFVKTDGSLINLLLTTSFIYQFNDSANQWQFLFGVAQTTLTASTAAGSNSFSVASTTGLTVSAPIGIVLSDNTQLQTTIASVGTGTITTAANVPTGKTAPNGAAIVVPEQYNGSLDFQPVAVTWAATQPNLFIWTNGVDPPKQFDGTQTKTLVGWTFNSCRILVEFHGFLIALDTTEGSVRYPQRVRNSDEGNPQNWSSGLANFTDLVDTEDFIMAAEPLGPWLIIYREASVMRRSYIGDPLQLFFDEYMLQGVGVLSSNCVAVTGSGHIFAGEEGIFKYSGGYDYDDVSDKIYDYVFSPTGIFNQGKADRVFCFYVAELDEVWMFIPTVQNNYCDTLLRYNLGDDSWWIRKFANQMIGFGFLESIAGRSWQQATQTWASDTQTWISRTKQPEAPQTLLLDPVNNQVWLYDYQSSTDAGNNIPWSFSTKDFEVVKRKITVDAIWAKGTGSNIKVEISVDRGQTYLPFGTFNFGLTPTTQNINMQITADVARFRFSGNDPAFSLDWYRVDYYEATPW